MHYLVLPTFTDALSILEADDKVRPKMRSNAFIYFFLQLLSASLRQRTVGDAVQEVAKTLVSTLDYLLSINNREGVVNHG